MASSDGAGNPYLAALAAVESSIYPELPAGYKTRLTTQIAMCGILVILCLVYCGMSMFDLRRRGKRFRMIRLQQIAGANGHRLIVLNSLFLWIMLFGVSTVILILNKWREWVIHVEKGSSRHFALLSVMIWWFSMLSSWCFTFANVAATIQCRSKGRGFESASWVTVAAHNASLVGFIVVYLGAIVPLTFLANYWNNISDVQFRNLMNMLRQAADAFDANPSVGPSEALLADIQSTQALGLEASARYLKYFKPAVYMASSFACFFALLNCVSFWLVVALRRQTRWYRTRTANISESIFVSRDQRVEVEDDHSAPPPPAILDLNASKASATLVGTTNTQRTMPFGTSTSTKMKGGKKVFSSAAADNAALARLATDLTIGVPLVCTISVYFTVSGVLGMTKFGVSPRWTEFIISTYGWAHTIMGIACLTFFITNMIVNAGRYGTFSSGGASSAGRVFTTNVSRAQHTIDAGPEMPIELDVHNHQDGSSYRADKKDEVHLGDDEKWL